MKTRSRWLLFALPLLLLVPLGAAKWRADQRKKWQAEHPPLSKLDKAFREAARGATAHPNAQITVFGGSKITGTPKDLAITDDRLAFQEIAKTLRCDDTLQAMGKRDLRDSIMVAVTYKPVGSMNQRQDTYYYWHTTTGSYVRPELVTTSAKGFRVHTRFAPRFEALLTRWAQRAKDGKHPQYALRALFQENAPPSSHTP